MAVRVIRKFRLLFDVVWGTPNDGDVPTYDAIQDKLVMAAPSGSGDLSDAVILQPADSARNVITPTSAGDDGLTIQNGRLVVSPDQSTVGISVREQDVSQAFGDGYELLDAHGHKQLAIYTQRYPLDPTRREAVVELIAKNNADGSVTNGSFLVYGGGNMGVTSDSSVVYPIFWTDGDTGKKLFLLKKDGAVIFGGGGSAPPDSDLSNGGIALWLDATDGAPKVMFKGKDVDGTVFTWELPTGVMGLASDLASHLADTSAAHAASAISFSPTGTIAATDVQDAIAEVASEAGADAADLAAHLADTSDAHDASAISVADSAGNFTGTDVEAVLAELHNGGIAPFVRPEEYGAVGDGVTDDTDAFQDALTAMSSGGTLLLDAKTYVISDTLDLGLNKSLVGMGRESSQLDVSACTGICVNVGVPSQTVAPQVASGLIKDLQIIGGGASVAGPIGIRVIKCLFPVVENVSIRNIEAALWIDADDLWVANGIVLGLTTWGVKYGITLAGDAGKQVNQMLFMGGYVGGSSENGAYGIKVGSGNVEAHASNRFIGMQVESFDGVNAIGVWVHETSDVGNVFIGCGQEACTTAFQFDVDAYANLVVGNATSDPFVDNGIKNQVITNVNRADSIRFTPYAASITPDLAAGTVKLMEELTGNITVNNPSGLFRGAHLIFLFQQDGTGGHAITWGSKYKVGQWVEDRAASTRSAIHFVYDDLNDVLVAIGGVDGGGGGTRQAAVTLTNPQTSANAGNAFFSVLGLTDWDAGHWEFVKDVDGKVYGVVKVPPDYSSGGALKLSIAANATSGVTRLGVGTKAVADGESLNPTLTDETKQDITVPGTAYLWKVVSFTLTETLAAGDLLIVEIFHEGSHTNDTLDANTLLFGAWLEYTA